jgi:hypothetical protein
MIWQEIRHGGDEGRVSIATFEAEHDTSSGRGAEGYE